MYLNKFIQISIAYVIYLTSLKQSQNDKYAHRFSVLFVRFLAKMLNDRLHIQYYTHEFYEYTSFNVKTNGTQSNTTVGVIMQHQIMRIFTMNWWILYIFLYNDYLNGLFYNEKRYEFSEKFFN